jgi:hypothetical protein
MYSLKDVEGVQKLQKTINMEVGIKWKLEKSKKSINMEGAILHGTVDFFFQNQFCFDEF